MAEESTQQQAQPEAGQRGHRQVKVGRVVSDKMDKTVVVAVESTATHRLYHRTMKRTTKFHAHDEENQAKVGDLVEIVSSRPLSKTKRWRLRQIVERAR
jgi:small subunit ribosomal protein S17